MRNASRAAWGACVGGLVAGAIPAAAQPGAPVEIMLDEGSVLAATVTVDLGSPSTATDSVGLAGGATLRFDPDAGLVTLVDFEASIVEPLVLSLSFGFIGSVDLTLSSFVATLEGSAPIGPVAVAAVPGPGEVTFPQVPVDVAGSGTATGSILLLGPVNETVDLAEFGPFVEDLPGTLSFDPSDRVLTLASSFVGTATEEIAEGLPATVTVELTLSGSGVLSEPPCNPADVATTAGSFGTLDGNDISGFVAAFVAGDPLADLVREEGVVMLNGMDLAAFVSAFLSGCP